MCVWGGGGFLTFCTFLKHAKCLAQILRLQKAWRSILVIRRHQRLLLFMQLHRFEASLQPSAQGVAGGPRRRGTIFIGGAGGTSGARRASLFLEQGTADRRTSVFPSVFPDSQGADRRRPTVFQPNAARDRRASVFPDTRDGNARLSSALQPNATNDRRGSIFQDTRDGDLRVSSELKSGSARDRRGSVFPHTRDVDPRVFPLLTSGALRAGGGDGRGSVLQDNRHSAGVRQEGGPQGLEPVEEEWNPRVPRDPKARRGTTFREAQHSEKVPSPGLGGSVNGNGSVTGAYASCTAEPSAMVGEPGLASKERMGTLVDTWVYDSTSAAPQPLVPSKPGMHPQSAPRGEGSYPQSSNPLRTGSGATIKRASRNRESVTGPQGRARFSGLGFSSVTVTQLRRLSPSGVPAGRLSAWGQAAPVQTAQEVGAVQLQAASADRPSARKTLTGASADDVAGYGAGDLLRGKEDGNGGRSASLSGGANAASRGFSSLTFRSALEAALASRLTGKPIPKVGGLVSTRMKHAIRNTDEVVRIRDSRLQDGRQGGRRGEGR